jgi:hypothetical protein
VFIKNVPLARAVEPPKLDQLRPLRTVLPSPQLNVSSLGRLTAVLQLVIFSGEEAKAEADTAIRTATAIKAPTGR